MTRRYTPQEKKRMSYKRDRVSSRNSARERRSHRTSKARGHRAARSRARQTLHRMLSHFPIRDDLALPRRPRMTWIYADGAPLRQRLEHQRGLYERRAAYSVLSGYFVDEPELREARYDTLSARLAHWRTFPSRWSRFVTAHLARVWFMAAWHQRGFLGCRDLLGRDYPHGRDELVQLFKARPHERALFEAWLAREGFTADAPPPY